MTRFKTGSNFSVPLQANDALIFNELYLHLSADGNEFNNREFARELAKLALTAIKGGDQALKHELEAKVNENIELIERIQILESASTENSDEITQENQRLQAQVAQLNELQVSLHQQIEDLKEQLSQGLNLDPERQFIVTMDPFTAYLMKVTCEGETKRLGDQITPENLLIQMFLSYYQFGEHEHFPFYFTRRQLSQLAEHFKNAENSPQE